ncbi:MAG: UDP-N-acetylglucosamine 2-epimerase (non-hydrolyzing) [Micrococcales bacterium]|nr:UDP-N-acetylglucosamine 2-epimerase (non-hydrolyzing) [Micrococcales bacterium]
MKVVSVVGARPQFVKLAPMAAAMDQAGLQHIIVHTGQHYDPNMSGVFFADLKIPAPDINLEVGSGAHGAQTGQMMAGLEKVFTDQAPDWVLVYGDTNTTLAGALAAVKDHWPIAHLEAGLRSFNRRMPEEINRVLTDHAADLLLAPTEVAMGHLAKEGLAARAHLVGDVMTDVLYKVRDAVTAQNLVAAGDYLVSTIHRAENTDSKAGLARIIDQLAALPIEVRLLVHPRLAAKAKQHGLSLNKGAIKPAQPLAYPQMVAAVLGSRGVVTDSGGLQKEAFLLDRPCTTLRPETEWTETLAGGWNVLALDAADLAQVVMRPTPTTSRGTPYGDGRAAQKAVITLLGE